MEIQQISSEHTIDRSLTMYPTVLRAWRNPQVSLENQTSHYYGFVSEGEVQVHSQSSSWTLKTGMYFSLPGSIKIMGQGLVAAIERIGYRGLSQCGGPIESSGRLVYIDNCHTTLLVPPPRQGDPVFNLLVFPPHIEQSFHLHPSIRMGLVVKGSGLAVFKDKKVPLRSGMVFCLEERETHCFYSDADGLSVVAYHPDSDWGPVDSNHPMLNRTYRTS